MALSPSPSQNVPPLRVAKMSSTPQSRMTSGIPRPLSEISPSEKRRNSPSWNHTIGKATMSDSSPFQSSPNESTSSPRLFWKNRNMNSENEVYGARGGSPSPTRRSSLERVQKASRVKNSNILALEHKQGYDPTRVPKVERPLSKINSNTYSATARSPRRSQLGHSRSESKVHLPLMAPYEADTTEAIFEHIHSREDNVGTVSIPRAYDKELTGSPIKSSLSMSRFKSSFETDLGFRLDGDAEDIKLSNRLAKSVTFDAAPPQVNEYEMATPDLSSVGSNSREGSYDSMEDDDDEHSVLYQASDINGHEDSFDASLEDTDKTPVVGPDDWRQEGSSASRYLRSPSSDIDDNRQRTASGMSNSESRPLPPLPGTLFRGSPGASPNSEKSFGGQRGLPSPPSATPTKVDGMTFDGRSGKLTLEERLKLMMNSPDEGDAKMAAEQQRERRLRRAGNRDKFASPTPEPEVEPPIEKVSEEAKDDILPQDHDNEEVDTLADLSMLGDYHLPPKISRESIMRRVDGNKTLERESDYVFSASGTGSRLFETGLPLDPDTPIPSTEDSVLSYNDDDSGSVMVKRDRSVSEEDSLYIDHDGGDEDQVSDLDDDDDASQYSNETKKASPGSPFEASTPRRNSPFEPATFSAGAAEVDHTNPGGATHEHFSQDFTHLILADSEDGAILADESPFTDRYAAIADTDAALLRSPSTPPRMPLSKPEYDGSGWGYSDDEFERAGTPDSVIHHPILEEEADGDGYQEDRQLPSVPERDATIRASGAKLKTRPSATPSDLLAMREARRQISGEVSVPPIPDRHQNRMSRDMDAETAALSGPHGDEYVERHPSFKSRSLKLDFDLGLSLDKDFDRVIESQKVADFHFSTEFSRRPRAAQGDGRDGDGDDGPSRPASVNAGTWTISQCTSTNSISSRQRGYLMRQNTKLVAASDHDGDDRAKIRSTGNSPVKLDRPTSWTVEPWNSKSRSKTVRKRAVGSSGPVPPLPGQESNTVDAKYLEPLTEEELAVETGAEECGERGRLFVKVMGIKDLDLPLPRNERTWFCLTLDNGVHCVTTAWLELARNAPIGQEFELVVPNDLEFQLTLNVKLEKPAEVVVPVSPTETTRHKASTLSRVFASPKKRKEMELRQREEEERVVLELREAAMRAQVRVGPSAWHLLSPLAAEDGSFGRAYVCLKEHESRCFGRPYTTEVACFNEWATEEAGFVSSVKSKRGDSTIVRRAPYKIGKLELQLMFVPRPKGAVDDDMPKSMNACIRELKAVEERLSMCWEGHLSQQGGDCPFWRRRYFKLNGTTLTAYHESTRQIRATINLYNAKRLIDDRRSLTERETVGRGGRRRRSAFAEEEDGYMFVEEGFRIRFNNGEVIDFYADTGEDKNGWMRALSEVIDRSAEGPASHAVPGDRNGEGPAPGARGKWCDMVLKREEALRRRAEERRAHGRPLSMQA